MKIIKTGALPAPDESRWWYCCEHTCLTCGTVYQLEPGDAVEVMTERCIDGESYATSQCPHCGFYVQTVRSKVNLNTWEATE